jgi:hypothetical protein
VILERQNKLRVIAVLSKNIVKDRKHTGDPGSEKSYLQIPYRKHPDHCPPHDPVTEGSAPWPGGHLFDPSRSKHNAGSGSAQAGSGSLIVSPVRTTLRLNTPQLTLYGVEKMESAKPAFIRCLGEEEGEERHSDSKLSKLSEIPYP